MSMRLWNCVSGREPSLQTGDVDFLESDVQQEVQSKCVIYVIIFDAVSLCDIILVDYTKINSAHLLRVR